MAASTLRDSPKTNEVCRTPDNFLQGMEVTLTDWINNMSAAKINVCLAIFFIVFNFTIVLCLDFNVSW